MKEGLCVFSGQGVLTRCRAQCGVVDETVSDTVTMGRKRKHVSVEFTE